MPISSHNKSRLIASFLFAALASTQLTGTAHSFEAPVPQPRPNGPAETEKAPSTPEIKPTSSAKTEAAVPAEDNDLEDEVVQASGSDDACERELQQRGVSFTKLGSIKDSNQCVVNAPIQLRTLAANIRLDNPATLTCKAALAITTWVQDSVVPNLKIAMPDKEIRFISNASSYVCRNRNHQAGGKISEHAKGNAFDISTIGFSDGTKLVMKPRGKDGTMEGAFQRTITTSACLFFTTVLSPGSDATHQDHLHLDVMQRKNDFRYCR